VSRSKNVRATAGESLEDKVAPAPEPSLRGELARSRRNEARLSEEVAEGIRRVAETEELFRLLVASVRDYAIFMLDPSGHVATWNAGAERIKGYRAEEILGRHFSIFYPEEVARSGTCDRELEIASRHGRFEEEGWRLRKGGQRFWADVVITAVRDRDGRLIGYSKVTRDLTDRMRAEEERAARLAAEQASRAKDEFLAMLGHELRNPLAPIVTALQLMKLRGDRGSTREQEVIERQVAHMVHLVDDLLDVSRIASGKFELRRRRFDLRDAVGKAIEIACPLLEQRQHRFELDVPRRRLVVDGDEARLTQVLSHLINNAAKYTEPGGEIRVAVRLEGEEIEIDVSDTGIGIEPAMLPRVFELFVQGSQGADRPAGGLGLGLTLVRTLVDMHGGTVEARSPGIGRGSTFTIRLPCAESGPVGPGEDPVAPAPRARTRRGRRVLLVDDNEDALMLLAEAIEAAGHEVATALDAVEALRVIERFTPEVAVLDIGLPVMDGYELADKMRAEMGGRAPRLLALTGYGSERDRARTREAGFEAHFVKPVDVRRLIECIQVAGAPRG